MRENFDILRENYERILDSRDNGAMYLLGVRHNGEHRCFDICTFDDLDLRDTNETTVSIYTATDDRRFSKYSNISSFDDLIPLDSKFEIVKGFEDEKFKKDGDTFYYGNDEFSISKLDLKHCLHSTARKNIYNINYDERGSVIDFRKPTISDEELETIQKAINSKDIKYVVGVRYDSILNDLKYISIMEDKKVPIMYSLIDIVEVGDLRAKKVDGGAVLYGVQDEKVINKDYGYSGLTQPLFLDENFKVVNVPGVESHLRKTPTEWETFRVCTSGCYSSSSLGYYDRQHMLSCRNNFREECLEKDDGIKLLDVRERLVTIKEEEFNSLLRTSYLSDAKYMVGLRHIKDDVQGKWMMDVIDMDDFRFEKVGVGACLYAETDDSYFNPNIQVSGICQPILLDSNFNIVNVPGVESSIVKTNFGEVSFQTSINSAYGSNCLNIDDIKRTLDIKQQLNENEQNYDLEQN